jgi:ethanolamine utilization protein EutQ
MKRLITASTIQQEKAAGHAMLEVSLPNCIITPEARLVASQIGIKIIETVIQPQKAVKLFQPMQSAIFDQASLNEKDLSAIRQAIVKHLPEDKKLDNNLITQLIKKTIATQSVETTSATPSKNVAPKKIKHVASNTIQMGIFSEAGEENKVGIADVITSEDNSPMAGGFMAWKNCFFPWTLNYDEIDLVLEGELHIRHEDKTIVGKTGDVLFIPKGSKIEFGTPTSVRFFYVAHPANWQDC